MMYWTEHKGVTFLQFPAMRGLTGVFHGVFLRFAADGRDGSSPLHLGLNCGAGDDDVWRNLRRIGDLFGARHMVFARQVHGAEVLGWPPNSEQADHEPGQAFAYLPADALTTDKPRQALFIQVADCQPVLLVDPVRRVVANVHSGWRGSIRNIIGRTVASMQADYGCRPERILAGIGPSLGPCCAEFVNYRKEIPAGFWPYRLAADHFDFWRMSEDQLVAAGLERRNISQSRICTRCNQHLLFSYRGEKNTGRFAAVIGLTG
ncbi:MAG: polyphenol oxidase family protein [Desulfosarcinaceae bacterium]